MDDSKENTAHTIGASVRPLALGTLAAAPEHDDEDLRLLAAKWAGGLYLAFVAFTLLAAPKESSPVALIIDVALSIALLRGQLKWRAFFIFRLCITSLFAVVMGVAASTDDGVLEALFTLCITGFQLLLVVGTPGTVRRRIAIAVGCALVGLCALGLLLA
ncbi:MAG TPA: hypothetical protein VGF99_00795 [Myxococcota bacterium]